MKNKTMQQNIEDLHNTIEVTSSVCLISIFQDENGKNSLYVSGNMQDLIDTIICACLSEEFSLLLNEALNKINDAFDAEKFALELKKNHRL